MHMLQIPLSVSDSFGFQNCVLLYAACGKKAPMPKVCERTKRHVKHPETHSRCPEAQNRNHSDPPPLASETRTTTITIITDVQGVDPGLQPPELGILVQSCNKHLSVSLVIVVFKIHRII
jgi:hypothetical protein